VFTSTKRTIKTILTVIAVIVFTVFAVANRTTVAISLFPLPYSVDVPLFLLVLLCFALGVMFAGLTMGTKLSRSNRMLKKERKHATALHNELTGLKAAPTPPPSLPAAHV
jgi:lipopolysaccharide assembly protein A